MSEDLRLRWTSLLGMTLGSGIVGGLVALGLAPAPVQAPAPLDVPVEAPGPPVVEAPELEAPGLEAPKVLETPQELGPLDPNPLGDGPPFAALDVPQAKQSEFIAKTRLEALAGDVDAMLRLADWMTTEHSQVDYDEVKANTWLRRARAMTRNQRGFVRARVEIAHAELLAWPHDPRRANPEAAALLFREALQAADTTSSQRISALLFLARMQTEGLGMPRDPEAAFEVCARAAESALLEGKRDYGTEQACEALAGKLLRGEGCAVDVAAAAIWYRRAIESASFTTDSDFAPLLEIYTANPTLEDAVPWLEEHAKSGQALFVLGRIYEEGEVAQKDEAKAAGFYRRAAKEGHAFAGTFLSRLLERRPDLVQAEAE